jgi:hypothetical protein
MPGPRPFLLVVPVPQVQSEVLRIERQRLMEQAAEEMRKVPWQNYKSEGGNLRSRVETGGAGY